MARLVNLATRPSVAVVATTAGAAVDVVSTVPTRWYAELRAFLRQWDDPASQCCILTPTRTWNKHLANVLQTLSERDEYAFFVRGLDGDDTPQLRQRKVTVCTWHSSKGLEFEAVVVLDVSDAAQRAPLHVALTRAKRRLLVVHNADKPSPTLLYALARMPSTDVRFDAATHQLVHTAAPATPPPHARRRTTPTTRTFYPFDARSGTSVVAVQPHVHTKIFWRNEMEDDEELDVAPPLQEQRVCSTTGRIYWEEMAMPPLAAYRFALPAKYVFEAPISMHGTVRPVLLVHVMPTKAVKYVDVSSRHSRFARCLHASTDACVHAGDVHVPAGIAPPSLCAVSVNKSRSQQFV